MTESFRGMTDEDLASCVEQHGAGFTIDFWDANGNQVAFGAPDGFEDWIKEVQKRLTRSRQAEK